MNPRPSDYEPDELPTAPPRDVKETATRTWHATRNAAGIIITHMHIAVKHYFKQNKIYYSRLHGKMKSDSENKKEETKRTKPDKVKA